MRDCERAHGVDEGNTCDRHLGCPVGSTFQDGFLHNIHHLIMNFFNRHIKRGSGNACVQQSQTTTHKDSGRCAHHSDVQSTAVCTLFCEMRVLLVRTQTAANTGR